VLLGPEFAIGSVFGLWAIGGSVLSAGAHLAVRALRTDHRPETIVFWFQLGGTVLAVALLLLTMGRVPLPPAHLWPHLLGCGVAATFGQILMTRAYALDTAPVVAAGGYVGPLWGVLGDVMVFGTGPGLPVWVGGALVLAAGALLVRGGSGPTRDEAPSGAADAAPERAPDSSRSV
jgi:drug/metabolite transporter (DMT)-like permease